MYKQMRMIPAVVLLLLHSLLCSCHSGGASNVGSSTGSPNANSSAMNSAPAEQQLPQPQGMVSDFAGKLSPEVKEKLETTLLSYAQRNEIDIVVVTIPFDYMQGAAIEDYSLKLARQWGIGRGPKNLGLLLLIAIKPADAEGRYHGGTRLEVSRQLESDIPNELAGEIIRKMRDDFTAGRFDRAVIAGAENIFAILAEKRGMKN